VQGTKKMVLTFFHLIFAAMNLEIQNINSSIQELQLKLDSVLNFVHALQTEKEKNKPKQWNENINYDVHQIAEYLEIKADTVRKILKRLNLEYRHKGGKIVFSKQVADKLIKYRESKQKKRTS